MRNCLCYTLFCNKDNNNLPLGAIQGAKSLPSEYYNLKGYGRLRVVSLLSWRFLTKPDCILSSIQLVKLSFGTDKRAVSEGISYPIITDLDILPADYPIFINITREV